MLDLRGMNADAATAAVAAAQGGDVHAAAGKRQKRRVSTTRDAVSILIGAAMSAGAVYQRIYSHRPTEGGGGPLCADDFADAVLADEWNVLYGTVLETGGLLISTGVAAKTPGVIVTCAHMDDVDDGYVEAKVFGMATGDVGICGRMNDEGSGLFSGVGLLVKSSTGNLTLASWAGGLRTDTDTGVSVDSGDTIRLELVEDVATMYINGVSQGPKAIPKGLIGKWGVCGESASLAWDDFEGGTL